MNPKRATFVVVVSAALAVLGPAQAGHDDLEAQLRVRPIDLEDGAVALGLTLRQLTAPPCSCRQPPILMTRTTRCMI